MNNIELFKELKYGLMIHFGLYSLLGGYYKGKKGPHYAEWIQANQQISVVEMKKLATVFNPIYFDADEICQFALKCGMKYFVITTKHHEGFALFRSSVDKFNVYDATPFKRDIIKELADSCKKYGLKLGFYYSQCIDWNEKVGEDTRLTLLGQQVFRGIILGIFLIRLKKIFHEFFIQKCFLKLKNL